MTDSNGTEDLAEERILMTESILNMEESAIAAGVFSVLSSAADVLVLNARGNCARQ